MSLILLDANMLPLWGEIIAIITGLVGLIGTGISTFFAIRAVIKKNKNKSLSEIWELLMEIADSAMKTAEETGKSGAAKKEIALETIKASAKTAGIDIDLFIDQLDAYIDQSIAFANKIANKNK